MQKRWFLGLVATLVVCLGLSFWFGFANVLRSLGALPWWCWVVVPAQVTLGYLLLFQRWQFYLRQLGHPPCPGAPAVGSTRPASPWWPHQVAAVKPCAGCGCSVATPSRCRWAWG